MDITKMFKYSDENKTSYHLATEELSSDGLMRFNACLIGALMNCVEPKDFTEAITISKDMVK